MKHKTMKVTREGCFLHTLATSWPVSLFSRKNNGSRKYPGPNLHTLRIRSFPHVAEGTSQIRFRKEPWYGEIILEYLAGSIVITRAMENKTTREAVRGPRSNERHRKMQRCWLWRWGRRAIAKECGHPQNPERTRKRIPPKASEKEHGPAGTSVLTQRDFSYTKVGHKNLHCLNCKVCKTLSQHK